MRILLCIDDTDSIDSLGTGELAEMIGQAIEENGWGRVLPITRHQLLVHDDIPYTSHNSSMCFEAEVEREDISKIISYAKDFLAKESAKGSDPGLCVVNLEDLTDREKLIDFGYMAKRQVLKKEDAYKTAEEIGAHLSEHGGTGLGVIGALAGAGLRFSGNDGRLRGKLDLEHLGNPAAVKSLLSHQYIGRVEDLEGNQLKDEELVLLEGKIKTVLLNGQFVLLVTPVESDEAGIRYKNCSKQRLKKY